MAQATTDFAVSIRNFISKNEMSLKSDNVEFVRYCGGHFQNGDS
jgi:hypothetical protein